MKNLEVLGLIISSVCFAREPRKSVSVCAKDLGRAVFSMPEKAALKHCREYSQETIDCAVEDFRLRGLGRTFENALEDCSRTSEK